MSKVFKFEFSRTIWLYTIYTFLCLVFVFFLIWGSWNPSATYYTTCFGYGILGFCIVIIFYNFSYNKKKITTDLYYSMPVTKKELFLGKYIYSILSITAFSILCLIFSYIFIGLMAAGLNFDGSSYILSNGELFNVFKIFAVKYFFTVCFFNVCLFIYYRANTIMDGIIYLVIIMLIPKLFMDCLNMIVDNQLLSTYKYNSISYLLPSMIINWSEFIIKANVEHYAYYATFVFIISFLCLSTILYLVNYCKNDFAERVEETENKIFGYSVLVPLILCLLMLLCAISFSAKGIAVLILVLITITSYLLFSIFERKILINKKNRILILLIFTINLLFTIIL